MEKTYSLLFWNRVVKCAFIHLVFLTVSNAFAYSEIHDFTPRKNVAKVTDRSRSASYNDFLRAIWVDHGVSVNMITRGIRGFFTASSFVEPHLTVDGFLRFVGNFYREGQDFVVMNCKPTLDQRLKLQPVLATWPNTFAAIVSDLAGPNRDCLSPTLTPGEREICNIAIQYHDVPYTVYTVGLAQTLSLGAQVFATPESREAMSRDYGIFTSHTGLGFVVQASAAPTGDIIAMTTAQVLRNSVVPEYLLKNSTLADANCRCLQVPESFSLHKAPIDPDFIWKRGELDNGNCRVVQSLHI